MTDEVNKEDAELLEKLEIIGNNPRYLWKIFLLCMLPSILNGLNVTSYVYLADTPVHWCDIPELDNVTWTQEEIRIISGPYKRNKSSCETYDFDYAHLAKLPFDIAEQIVQNSTEKNVIPCTKWKYADDVHSMVVDFDLVCDGLALKSAIQVAISFGKFVGAFFFGIVSDKLGRRTSFLCGCLLYIISGPLIAFAPVYWLVIIGRVGLGAAGSGIYHSAFVILSEIAHKKRRASLGILYNMSYPIGQIIVPIVAYFIRDWRILQTIISVPALFSFIFFWYLPESPMWLLSKQRRSEAAKFINEEYQKLDAAEQVVLERAISSSNLQELQETVAASNASVHENTSKTNALWMKLILSFDQVFQIIKYAELRWRILITFFTWCVCSFGYYGLALNVENFGVDRYIYGVLTGFVEALSYILPLPLLRYMGRRATAILLFYISGLSLLLILGIPQSQDVLLLLVASIGRLCVSGVFAVVILQVTELFPTLLRNTAIGIGSTASHIGSMCAPLFVDLAGQYSPLFPSTTIGFLTIAAGTLIFLLPETRNQVLPNSVQDIRDGPKSSHVGLHQVCR